MSKENLKDFQYDAFLSHNSHDKPSVEQIALWLEDEAKLKVWLDKWNLVPGDPWQEDLERALDQSHCCVVFLGPHGIGSWQNEEMRVAISKRVSRKAMRVVPVLLPNALRPEKESELPDFLRRLTWVKFSDRLDEPETLYRLLCGIQGIAPGRSASENTPNMNPFRGLEVFREEDAPFFFGRENVVQQLLDYFQNHRFLAVIGPSGSGKSSVVQAGLIPALKSRGAKSEERKALDRSSSPSTLRPLPYALFTPQDDPFRELAIALRPLISSPSYSAIIEALMDAEKELEYISRGICRDSGEARLLLIIDQFEEVFTQTTDEHKRQRFFASLLNTVESPNCPILIVLTMRSDFLGKCAAYADLNTFVIDHLFQIGPMAPQDLREAIEAPAHLVGLEFDEGLVTRILKDAVSAPGGLPLIEHALLELYERRRGNKLTTYAYDIIGGISGALVKRAEAEFARLKPVQQEILRKMFVLRLIQPGEGTEDTRRRATKEELLATGDNAKEADAVLQQWTNARLLTTTCDEEKKQEIVDVTHEALIRAWPCVQNWLKEARETSRLLGLVRHATHQWLASDKSIDYLWLGAQLARAEELYVKHAEDLTLSEKDFIEEGAARRNRETQKELEHARQLAQAIDESKLKRSQIHWETAMWAREQDNLLLFSHFVAEAGKCAPNQHAAEFFIKEGGPALQGSVLKNILPHKWCVHGARFDSTGKRILTWSGESRFDERGGMACLWEAQTGKLIGRFMNHAGDILGAVFDRAQKRILTWSENGTARLWDAQTGHPMGHTMKHDNRVSRAVFDEGESCILTWSLDSTARLWEAQTGKPIGRPMKHKDIIWNAMFDTAQNRILTYSKDGMACLWETRTGKPMGQPMEHKGSVNGAMFDQVQKRILTWSDGGTARLWDAETGKPLCQPMEHRGCVGWAVFDRAQKRILTWSTDGTARWWDVYTGRSIGQPIENVWNPVFDQVHNRILTWSADGTARLLDAETGHPIGRPMEHGAAYVEDVRDRYSAVFDQAHKRILTYSGYEFDSESQGMVRLWEAETGKLLIRPIKHKLGVRGAMFDQAEKRILTWSKDCTACLWEIETGKQIGQLMHEDGVLCAEFDPADERILTWSGHRIFPQDRVPRLWDARTGQPIGQPMIQEKSIQDIAFDLAQMHTLDCSADGTARLWDIPGDLDFPHEHLVLQVQALTATRLDLQSREISVIPTEEWQALQKQYLAIAREHAKACQYKRQNVYLRFWGEEVKGK